MATVRLYTMIYVALLVLAASKWAFFQAFDYWTAVSLTMVTAGMKTALIVGYFQHLRYEPRILTLLMFVSFLAVVLLGAAASFSIAY